jgi:hypothetical protein
MKIGYRLAATGKKSREVSWWEAGNRSPVAIHFSGGTTPSEGGT